MVRRLCNDTIFVVEYLHTYYLFDQNMTLVDSENSSIIY